MDVEEVTSLAQPSENHRSEFLPWVEKYRPKNFDELISHHDIVSTCLYFIRSLAGFFFLLSASCTLLNDTQIV
jgi:hypothetical protein